MAELPDDRRRRSLHVLAMLVAVALPWLTWLPRDPRQDWADVTMELAWLLAVAVGYVWLPRGPVALLENGWRLVIVSLLMEVCDEFTAEPVVLGEYLTGTLAVGGLLLLGTGLQRALAHEQQEIAARQHAEAREKQAREDLARANAALREALQHRDDVVSIVAHDFRSPLTLIRGYAELLQGRAGDEESRRLLGVIARQAEQLASLAADTLTMSRIDSGTLPLEFGVVRVDELVRRVAALRGERVEVVLEDGAPLATTADAGRLEQVVQNLVDNALKYSPAGTPVRLRVERYEHGLRVAVQDEGPGIAASEVPLLFQKFSRLPAARRDGISGTGLGLFICRCIVEGHGGRLWVDSVPGRGATFNVLLPIAAEAPPA